MTNLSDYIGKLLAEITNARLQADMEAVRVAEFYSSHPLLSGMPAPRFRLPRIDIESPVIIKDVEEEPDDDPAARDRLDTAAVAKIAGDIVAAELAEKNLKLKPAEVTDFKKNMTTHAKGMGAVLARPVSMSDIARELSHEAVRSVKKIGRLDISNKVDPEELALLKAGIEKKLKGELIATRKAPPRIKVSALTHEIKEIKNRDYLFTLKLSISEEGVEVTKIEQDGDERDILVPE